MHKGIPRLQTGSIFTVTLIWVGVFVLLLAFLASSLPANMSSAEIDTDTDLSLFFKAAIAFSCILYGCFFLKKWKIGNIAIGMFVFSALLSLRYFHISPNDTDTNDIGFHLDYIQHVMNNWLNPYGRWLLQSNHPPLYYYVAGAMLEVNHALIGLPDKTVLRFLSWICFVVFHMFCLRTLRNAAFPTCVYLSCAAFLLFWPGGFHMASKINSEALYYAAVAVGFYYLTVWYQENRKRDLQAAVIAAAFSLAVRTNAVIFCILISLLVLYALIQKRTTIRSFFTRSWFFVYGIVLLCLCINLGQVLLFPEHSVFDGMINSRPSFSVSHYLSLDYSFSNPFNDWSSGFLEFMIKTSMFGEYRWPSPHIAIAINYCAVFLLIYSVLPWLLALPQHWRELLPYLLHIFLSIAFVIYFSLLMKDYSSQDFRYIYPTILCFVVLFGKVQVLSSRYGLGIFAWLGSLLVISLSAMSIFFFWNNFR